MAKFNGLSDETFHLHLKECEFRWNHKDADLYQVLLKILRQKSSLILSRPIEYNKTDEAKYQKFLENNDKIYGRQNDNWLPFFSKNSLMNKITNNSGTQNQNVDSSLAKHKRIINQTTKSRTIQK